jgi:hypothetical protein
VLDTALAHDEDVPAEQRIRAFLLRAEVAIYLDDHVLAEQYLNNSRQLLAAQPEYETVAEDREKLAALEEMLQ